MLIIFRKQAPNTVSLGVSQCFVMRQSILTWINLLLWFGCMFLLGQKSLPGVAGTSLAHEGYPASKNWHTSIQNCIVSLTPATWFLMIFLKKKSRDSCDAFFFLRRNCTDLQILGLQFVASCFLNPKPVIAKLLAAAVETSRTKGKLQVCLGIAHILYGASAA